MEGDIHSYESTSSKRCDRCGLEYPCGEDDSCPLCRHLSDSQAKRYGLKVREARAEANRPIAFLFALLAILCAGLFFYASK